MAQGISAEGVKNGMGKSLISGVPEGRLRWCRLHPLGVPEAQTSRETPALTSLPHRAEVACPGPNSLGPPLTTRLSMSAPLWPCRQACSRLWTLWAARLAGSSRCSTWEWGVGLRV